MLLVVNFHIWFPKWLHLPLHWIAFGCPTCVSLMEDKTIPFLYFLLNKKSVEGSRSHTSLFFALCTACLWNLVKLVIRGCLNGFCFTSVQIVINYSKILYPRLTSRKRFYGKYKKTNFCSCHRLKFVVLTTHHTSHMAFKLREVVGDLQERRCLLPRASVDAFHSEPLQWSTVPFLFFPPPKPANSWLLRSNLLHTTVGAH